MVVVGFCRFSQCQDKESSVEAVQQTSHWRNLTQNGIFVDQNFQNDTQMKICAFHDHDL